MMKVSPSSKRSATPVYDAAKLRETLEAHVVQMGARAALDLKDYNYLQVSQAIRGPALADNKVLLERLVKVAPSAQLLFSARGLAMHGTSR